jgi:hypothetical protein
MGMVEAIEFSVAWSPSAMCRFHRIPLMLGTKAA